MTTQVYTVVAGFFADGATCIRYAEAVSPAHAAELVQCTIQADMLGPDVDPAAGKTRPLVYIIAVFEGQHPNVYSAAEEA